MNPVNPLGSHPQPQPVDNQIEPKPRQNNGSNPSAPEDELTLSSAATLPAELLRRINELDTRQGLILEVQRRIADGTYEHPRMIGDQQLDEIWADMAGQ